MIIKKGKCLLSMLLWMLIVWPTTPLAAQKRFTFFALGDMPYHNPADLEKFQMLTATINTQKPAFTIHVGDIKNGGTPCSDEYFLAIRTLFNGFDNPLLYTPGDNEWTDCHRPGCGGYDPEERLRKLRDVFFKNEESLGRRPLKVRSQRHDPRFSAIVENMRWRKGAVTFATVHVVGSNNNLKTEGSNDEFHTRDSANVEWLKETFETARKNQDAALVLIMHGAMVYAHQPDNGYNNIVATLRQEVQAFAKPVLLLYGDLHYLQITKPLLDEHKRLIPNFTALMVFGDRDMHAVKVHVDTRSKEVFSFSEHIMKY